jgi:REP-associated tyrosine transposase
MLHPVSRLRRLVLSDRFFFVTCRVLKHRAPLQESDLHLLANVIRERRDHSHFFLTAWVFLPDHWHAIIFPRFPLTISRVMETIKVASTLRLNGGRHQPGLLWQRRFFDRALRTVKDYNEKVAYIHLNPVKAGLVRRAEDWPWSSAREYTGTLRETRTRHNVLPIDRMLLPADSHTRI